MMALRAVVMIQLMLLCCVLHRGVVCGSAGNKNGTRCLANELHILLELKEGFENKSGRLASWVGTDCCAWQGVHCDKLTGHVVSFNLGGSNLKVSLKPSIIGLKHLQFLDLSGNDFANSQFPEFLNSFQELSYLDLHDCNLLGSIPEQYGNISTLRYLDLSRNNIQESGNYWLHILSRIHFIHVLKLYNCGLTFLPQTLPNSSFSFLSRLDLSWNKFNIFPQWLSTLTSLEHLDFSYNYLSESDGQWMQKLGELRLLRSLKLQDIGLQFLPQELPNSSFASLSFLDLSGNDFYSTIPRWLYRITSLQVLDLSSCSFQGTISNDIGALSNSFFMEIDPKGPGSCCHLRELYLYNMSIQPSINLKGLGGFWSRCTTNSLEELDISDSNFIGNLPDWLWTLENVESLNLRGNSISGSIPAGIGKLTSLKFLDISDNQLNGSIDKSIGNLSKLETLYLDNNRLKGLLTASHFSQLVCLKDLVLSGNPLAVDNGSEWLPPFQLESIDVSGCPFIGPLFPPWLREQKKLLYLNMSSSLIRSLPSWFWSFALNVQHVDLSNNKIHGEIPSIVSAVNDSSTRNNSGSNSFHGIKKIPTSRINFLDLSNNSLSGPLPVDFSEAMPSLRVLYLYMNNFTGSIPYSLCDLAVATLDLSNNGLSGDIPSCWNKNPHLMAINFEDNHLSGEFPCSFCSSNSIRYIILNNNNISGNIPSCLKKCINLEVLDIGNNRLTGSIPGCLGESLLNIKFLSLQSNILTGKIPPELSRLEYLRFIDLSVNNLSGEIPLSLSNLTGMKFTPKITSECTDYPKYSSIGLGIKGSLLYYQWCPAEYFASIDLSCNKLSGGIPVELTDLTGLQNLNLSNNHLVGEITSKIGNLVNLESLDLSRNQLDGPIPDSLSNLSYLTSLNLSYNLLSGRIPTGNQLQTLDEPSIYEGNPNLCGPPLNISCEPPGVMPSSPDYIDSNGSGKDSIWNLGSMGFGFAAGLLGYCGFILYQSKWSDAYLHFVDMLFYKIFFKWLI